jgi:DNA-binding MarR family transcriptional regulator
MVELLQRLRAVAQPLSGRLTLSVGRRGVLTELERSGPRTVPQVARARAVTRQHVQALVNSLVREGMVELADNPEHRRSRLVRLTEAGRDWLAEATEREGAFLDHLALDVSDEELRVAKATLRAVGEALAEPAWRWAAKDETAKTGA